MEKNELLCQTFIDCCKTVQAKGLHMIRPNKDTPCRYDLCEPFEGGEDWIWLDTFTANVVCQVYEALSSETQEKMRSDSAERILKLCWKAVS